MERARVSGKWMESEREVKRDNEIERGREGEMDKWGERKRAREGEGKRWKEKEIERRRRKEVKREGSESDIVMKREGGKIFVHIKLFRYIS